MKKTMTILFAATLLAGSAHAADPVPASAPGKQQSKMATCNKEAGEKKGDERKTFMSSCLSNKPSQQTRMKTCNADAKGKTGDERRAFMSSCLSAKG